MEAPDDAAILFDLIKFFGLFCPVILLTYRLRASARKEVIKLAFCFFPSAVSEPKQRQSGGNAKFRRSESLLYHPPC